MASWLGHPGNNAISIEMLVSSFMALPTNKQTAVPAGCPSRQEKHSSTTRNHVPRLTWMYASCASSRVTHLFVVILHKDGHEGRRYARKPSLTNRAREGKLSLENGTDSPLAATKTSNLASAL